MIQVLYNVYEKYKENMQWINHNGFMMNDCIIFLSNF